MKQVDLIALRRFRVQEGDALVWIEPGQKYSIDENSVEFHVTTKRGKRLPQPKPKKD